MQLDLFADNRANILLNNEEMFDCYMQKIRGTRS